MSDFFGSMPLEAAQQVEQLSRAAFELREHRRRVLARYAVDDEEALLEKIREGAIPEHPAYEHCLGARELGAAREAVREELRALLEDPSLAWTR